MLVSRTRACDRALQIRLAARDDIENTYVALTWGVPDAGDGARRFRCRRAMQLDAEHAAGQDAHQRRAGRAAGRHGVRRRAGAALGPSGREYARVRCDLETGRQHQIRLHLAALGAPIVGDKLYGPDEQAFARSADSELTEDDTAMLELPRHALHAARLALGHPITGAQLVLEAPLPEDMRAFWDGLTAPLAGPGGASVC